MSISSSNREKVAPIVRFFGENSKQVHNMLSSEGTMDQVFMEQSAMVKCPHFARFLVGMDANNIGNLLSYKFLALLPVFHLNLLDGI